MSSLNWHNLHSPLGPYWDTILKDYNLPKTKRIDTIISKDEKNKDYTFDYHRWNSFRKKRLFQLKIKI